MENKVATDKPESQVEVQINTLAVNLKRIEEIEESLRQRLSQVLISEPPCERGEECEEPELVPLASFLRQINKGLSEVTGRLRNTHDRIEV